VKDSPWDGKQTNKTHTYNAAKNQIVPVNETTIECERLMKEAVARALCDAACITNSWGREGKNASIDAAMDAWIWLYCRSDQAIKDRALILELAGLDIETFDAWTDKQNIDKPTTVRTNLRRKQVDKSALLVMKYRMHCGLSS
jgi:hypothetical protein